MITPTSVLTLSDHQVSCDLDGDVIILNIRSGIYYGLDPVGARIWRLLEQPRSVHQVVDALREEYDVTPELCTADVLTLLRDMSAHGLLEAREA